MSALDAKQKDQIERMAKGEITPVQFFFTVQHGDNIPVIMARVVLFDGMEITAVHADADIPQLEKLVADYRQCASALSMLIANKREASRGG